MLNGLDLFSGYGGISLALREWVRPIVYCEIERYAQGILLSRISEGALPAAPIWDNVSTLDGNQFRGCIDIIYGGFPCQDISVAGAGKGMAGERSGLFREIVRLAKEIQPTFLFLENVPAIRTRGLDAVIEELTDAGYDLRWQSLSAAEVGAPHKRERWFMLANASGGRLSRSSQGEVEQPGRAKVERTSDVAYSNGIDLRIESGRRSGASREGSAFPGSDGGQEPLANTRCKYDQSIEGSLRDPSSQAGEQIGRDGPNDCSTDVADSDQAGLEIEIEQREFTSVVGSDWKRGQSFPEAWKSDAGILRVAHGIAMRVHRIKALGNGVVPLQARTAFKELMGLR